MRDRWKGHSIASQNGKRTSDLVYEVAVSGEAATGHLPRWASVTEWNLLLAAARRYALALEYAVQHRLNAAL